MIQYKDIILGHVACLVIGAGREVSLYAKNN